MPVDVNDPNLSPVSFVRGGLTIGGQVHLEGTYAFVRKEMAGWDEEMQLAKLGDVFFTQGIRRGFPPASQSYLSPEFRERIERETNAPAVSTTSIPATPAPGPAPEGLAPAVVGQQTTPEEPAEGSLDDLLSGEVSAPAPDEPFPGAATMVDVELRTALAKMPDEEVARFVAWELARPEPRMAILDELEMS